MNSVRMRAGALVLLTSGLLLIPTLATADLLLYEDELSPGWYDWSWGTNRSSETTKTRVKSGDSSLAVQFTEGWGGLSARRVAPLKTGAYISLRFWVYGQLGGKPVNVTIQTTDDADDGPAFSFTPTANIWREIVIPMSTLGNPTQIQRINFREPSGSGNPPTFYLDQVRLATKTIPLSLSINTQQERHVISPYIYGISTYDVTDKEMTFWKSLKLPIARFGGNLTSRYNWKLDTTNAAADWFYENVKLSDATVLPNDSAANRFIVQNRQANRQSLLTIPMLSYVAKNATACGFSINKYGPQQYADEWRSDCGNGVDPDGQYIQANKPTDTSTTASPAFVSEWVTYLKKRFGAGNQTGVRFYSLDNEPDLWHETHRDVSPTAVSYNKLRDLTYRYANAVKTADPTAATIGPTMASWNAYWHSPYDIQRDDLATPDDRNAHGGVAMVPWYLQQMKAYEQTNNRRILDYLDLHYYPAAANIAMEPAGNAATQALRLRSTRALWDPNYVDESWLLEAGIEGAVINLIPRMRNWVKTAYPGTKLSISEYNWGGLEHINGALTQADVLGIFGREGLNMAQIFGPPKPTEPGAFAFRMFRNYNGKGGQFGSISVSAKSTDSDQLAVYAAQEATTSALTVMVINKSTKSVSAPLKLAGFTPTEDAQVWRYSAARPGAIQSLPTQRVSATGWTVSLPKESITLFRLQGEVQ